MPKEGQKCFLARNESHNPNAQASGDRLQSEENDNMTNMLSPGVKLLANLVMSKKTSRKHSEIEFDKFPSQHCNMTKTENQSFCAKTEDVQTKA